jgi:hypothetical protein
MTIPFLQDCGCRCSSKNNFDDPRFAKVSRARIPAPHTAVLRQLQFCDKAVVVAVPDADIRTDRFATLRLCVKAVAVSKELPCAFLFLLRLCVKAVAVDAVRPR